MTPTVRLSKLSEPQRELLVYLLSGWTLAEHMVGYDYDQDRKVSLALRQGNTTLYDVSRPTVTALLRMGYLRIVGLDEETGLSIYALA